MRSVAARGLALATRRRERRALRGTAKCKAQLTPAPHVNICICACVADALVQNILDDIKDTLVPELEGLSSATSPVYECAKDSIHNKEVLGETANCNRDHSNCHVRE